MDSQRNEKEETALHKVHERGSTKVAVWAKQHQHNGILIADNAMENCPRLS